MTNTNYEKAMVLLNKGVASKHYTFKATGYIFINLDGQWVGYISPKDKYVDVAINNVHVAHGNIDLDALMVMDASHRHDYDRCIVVK